MKKESRVWEEEWEQTFVVLTENRLLFALFATHDVKENEKGERALRSLMLKEARRKEGAKKKECRFVFSEERRGTREKRVVVVVVVVATHNQRKREGERRRGEGKEHEQEQRRREIWKTKGKRDRRTIGRLTI